MQGSPAFCQNLAQGRLAVLMFANYRSGPTPIPTKMTFATIRQFSCTLQDWTKGPLDWTHKLSRCASHNPPWTVSRLAQTSKPLLGGLAWRPGQC